MAKATVTVSKVEYCPRMTITALQKNKLDVQFEGEWTALLVRAAISTIRRAYVKNRRTLRRTTPIGATTNG